MERDTTRRVAAELAVRYEKARGETSGGGEPLSIVDPASAPDQPLSSGVAKTFALDALAGFVPAATLVVARPA